MTFNRINALIVLCILLTSCGTNIPKDTYISDPEERELISRIKDNPEDINMLAEAGDFYRDRFLKNSHAPHALKAVEYYQLLLEKQPDFAQSNILIYDLYYRLHANNKQRNFERLNLQFDRIPESAHTEIIPPEIAEIHRLRLSRSKNEKKILELSLKGIKRNPKNPSSYIIAANQYSKEQQNASAIALIKRALKNHPDDIDLLNNLGSIYINKTHESACYLEDSKNWKNAINAFSKVKSIDSENQYARIGLSKSYLAVGQKQLGLNEAKKSHSVKETINTDFDLSIAYAINENFSQGRKHIDESIKKTKDISDKFAQSLSHADKDLFYKGLVSHLNKKFAANFAAIYLRNGYWYKSLEYYQYHNFRDRETYSIYPIILSKIVVEMTDSTWQPDYKLRPSKHSSWEQVLIDFWEGKINGTTLLSNATDNCKKMQANTYIGYKLYTKGDHTNAKRYLSAAREQKLPLLFEDSLAFHLLKEIEG